MDLRQLNRQKNIYLRRLKAHLAARLLDYKNPNVFAPEKVPTLQKILFLRNDNKIGDMIVSSAALRELKKQLPHAQISVLAGPKTALLLTENPYVDNVYIVKNSWFSIVKTGFLLRRQKFDLYIDLDMTPTAQTLLLLRLVQPNYAFGLNRTEKAYNLSIPFNVKNTHITGYYQQLFETLGLAFENKQYEIFLPQAATQAAENFLKNFPQKQRVALNAFAASKHRWLGWEQIKSLTSHFPQTDFILLGTPRQRKTLLYRQAIPKNLILPPENFGLLETLALLQKCNLLLSPDTMWVHAACAFQKPQICLYKQSDPSNQTVWAPLSDQKIKIIQAPHEFKQLEPAVLVRELTDFLK